MARSSAITVTEEPTGFKALEQATAAIEAAAEALAEGGAAPPIAADASGRLAETGHSFAEEMASRVAEGANSAAEPQNAGSAARHGLASLPAKSSVIAECMQLAKENFELQKSAIGRLAACRSPSQLFGLQLDLTRAAVARVSEASKRMSRATLSDLTEIGSKITPATR